MPLLCTHRSYIGVPISPGRGHRSKLALTCLPFPQDGSGYLNRKEFVRCLKAAELGLSKGDILQIMEAADEDGDGFITYSEFVPVATEVRPLLP